MLVLITTECSLNFVSVIPIMAGLTFKEYNNFSTEFKFFIELCLNKLNTKVEVGEIFCARISLLSIEITN